MLFQRSIQPLGPLFKEKNILCQGTLKATGTKFVFPSNTARILKGSRKSKHKLGNARNFNL